jgi:hypothetical protein
MEPLEELIELRDQVRASLAPDHRATPLLGSHERQVRQRLLAELEEAIQKLEESEQRSRHRNLESRA